jgi:hypothetical protein
VPIGSFFSRRTVREASVPNLRLRRLDAEWITAKKHWQDAQRRAKEQSAPTDGSKSGSTEGHDLRDISLENTTSTAVPESESEDNHESPPALNDTEPRDSCSYQPEMDDLRCILYAHGGMNLSPPIWPLLISKSRGLLLW